MKKLSKPLIFIIGGALLLRLVGIGHDYPFIFHPDEPTIVRSALGVRFYPNPKHFDWPHLYIYLNYLLYMGFAKFRTFLEVVHLRGLFSSLLPIIWDDNYIFYILTRGFSAILGGLTTLPVFLAGKKLFGEKVGLLSALIFALLPFHVWHSHYSLADIPMTFFLAWSLYFSVKILHEKKLFNYLLAGFFVGLAASTKYNGGLSAILIPLAHFFRVKRLKEPPISLSGLKKLFLSGLICLFGFILGTPYSVLDFETFSRSDGSKGAFWQFENVGSVSLSQRIPKFFADMTTKIPDDLGYVTSILYTLGFFLLLLNRLKISAEDKLKLWFLYVPLLLFSFYISGFAKSRSHYFFIIYPFVALISGYLLNFGLSKVSIKWRNVFCALCFSPLLYLSVYSTYRFVKDDTRGVFYKWADMQMDKSIPVFYNDSDIADILDALSVEKSKNLDLLEATSEGYVVLLSRDDLSKEEARYLPRKMDKIFVVDNKITRGPKIAVYKY